MPRTPTSEVGVCTCSGVARRLTLAAIVSTAPCVTRSKPAPDIYLRAAELLGVAPQECMALEDSPNGIRSAAAANLRVIMVPDLVMPNLELRELTVTVQSDLFGVQKFLEKFGDL